MDGWQGTSGHIYLFKYTGAWTASYWNSLLAQNIEGETFDGLPKKCQIDQHPPINPFVLYDNSATKLKANYVLHVRIKLLHVLL